MPTPKGYSETAPIREGYHQEVTRRIDRTLPWDHEELDRVTRLRLISDKGFPVWDVSYCHGKDVNGEPVNVRLPFSRIPKRRVSRFIVGQAKKDGVYAKGLGILDAISTFNGV